MAAFKKDYESYLMCKNMSDDLKTKKFKQALERSVFLESPVIQLYTALGGRSKEGIMRKRGVEGGPFC
eukprot:7107088-Pyramimonas_sp.AAC.1